MAKVTYASILPKFDNFSQFDGKTLKMTELAGDTFTLEDKDGTSMVFKGNNFERTDSVVTGGTIKSAQFFNADGERIYTFEGVTADAETVYKAFTLDKDPQRIIHGLMEGNDTVAGTKKADSLWGFGGDDTLNGKGGLDWLYGHRGTDTLTGGTGADTFVFLTGYDSDTVTDFDLTGSDHDFIRMDYYLFQDIVYTENAGNVTLTLPSGDALTLLNVTQAEIEGVTKFFDFF
jgi:Ca2+-binding RTX toxin-like protein